MIDLDVEREQLGVAGRLQERLDLGRDGPDVATEVIGAEDAARGPDRRGMLGEARIGGIPIGRSHEDEGPTGQLRRLRLVMTDVDPEQASHRPEVPLNARRIPVGGTRGKPWLAPAATRSRSGLHEALHELER